MASINPKFLFPEDAEKVKASVSPSASSASLQIEEEDVVITQPDDNNASVNYSDIHDEQDEYIEEDIGDMSITLLNTDEQSINVQGNMNAENCQANDEHENEASNHTVHYRAVLDYIKTLLDQFEQIKHLAVTHNVISQIDESVSEQIQSFIDGKAIVWDRKALDYIIASDYNKIVPYANVSIIMEKFLANQTVKADVEKYKFYVENVLVDKCDKQILTSKDIEQLYNVALKHYKIMQLADNTDIGHLVEDKLSLLNDEYTSKFENINNMLSEHRHEIDEIKHAIYNLSAEVNDIQATMQNIQETVTHIQQSIDEQTLLQYIKSIVEDIIYNHLNRYDTAINELILKNNDLSSFVQQELDQIRQEMANNMNVLGDQLNLFIEKTEEVLSTAISNNASQDSNKYAEDIQMIIESIQNMKNDLNSVVNRLNNMEMQVNTYQATSQANSTNHDSDFSAQFLNRDMQEQEAFSYTPNEYNDDISANQEQTNDAIVSPKKMGGIKGLLQNTKLLFVAGAILLLLGLLIIMKH